MNERGVDARVALIKRKDDKDIQVLPDLRSAPIVFDDTEDFTKNFTKKVFDNGFVVASTVEQAQTVRDLTDVTPKLRPVLHVQSYEPYMMPDKKSQNNMRAAFKLIPDVISSSAWITELLKQDKVKCFATVHPGVNRKLYYPKEREEGDERPTILIPMIKSYPFKGYERGVELIKELWNISQKRGDEIRILVYGCDIVPEAPVVVGLGPLSQNRLAKLLGTEIDVFLDPSLIHSYGMPALEALASGVAVVSWDNLGIGQYIKDGMNGRIFPREVPAREVAKEILGLLKDPERRKKFTNRNNMKLVLQDHDRQLSVDRFIDEFEAHFECKEEKYRIVFVTPHLRKHGGPTTILHLANKLSERGHQVSITSLYSDINPAVMEITGLSINLDPHNIPECDILVTNSDNPMNETFVTLKQAKKKVMLKLSQNARFKEYEEGSLNLPWDAIMTSTQWLKDACENPLDGWDHEPKEATRVGWFHYDHKDMTADRDYALPEDRPFIVGTLIHHHGLKGTPEALQAMAKVKEKMGDKVHMVGIGEVQPGVKGFQVPNWMEYVYSPDREGMAKVLSQLDIWVGASHTEGLGRMALEAMSAGAACILADTGAEFAKHEENCLIAPVGDAEAIRGFLERLLEDHDLRREISIRGFRTADAAADPEPCIDAIEKVFRGLMK
jgi:glycosyltransferase involved in cell wall biosynthesis